jgi:hypothetical protein
MKPMSFDFKSRRSMVVARRGMVAASNPLAAQAGLNILEYSKARCERGSPEQTALSPYP